MMSKTYLIWNSFPNARPISPPLRPVHSLSLDPCVFLSIFHRSRPLFSLTLPRCLSLTLYNHRHCQSACLKFETNINGALRSVMDGRATGRTESRGSSSPGRWRAGGSAFSEIRTETCLVVVRRTWHGSQRLFIFLMALVNILLLT